MGNETSGQSVRQALKDLLKVKRIGLKKEMLENFLKAMAPWFPVSGHLTGPSWEKLWKDLKFAEEQGVLVKGMLPVWKLVRNCIKDREKCGAELQNYGYQPRLQGRKSPIPVSSKKGRAKLSFS